MPDEHEKKKKKKKKEKETEKVEERTVISALTVHRAVRREGEEELARSARSLFWSGIAAGLAMGLSMAAEGVLHARLPDEAWRPLVSSFGYTLGFIVVTLGRQQLYTENTLTAVLPALECQGMDDWIRTLRLWGIVLGANLVGATVFAWFATTEAFLPEFREAFLEIGQHALQPDALTTLVAAIPAGWLVALIVWLGPAAPDSRLWVALILSYAVGILEFPHVIAGSVETLFVVFEGGATLSDYAGGYLLPTLVGNTIGGVMLVAVLNHSQVLDDEKE